MVLKPLDLESLVGFPPLELTEAFPSFHFKGHLVLSPEATLVIAESACRRNPHPILEEITEEEAKIRQNCRRGRTIEDPPDGETTFSWPAREYALYVK